MNITPFKGRFIDYNKSVKVYRNLNNHLLSVVQGGVVVAHTDEVALNRVTYHIEKAGQKKCRETNVRTVHAYVKGFLDSVKPINSDCRIVKYNPYKYDTFVDEKDCPIKISEYIYIKDNGNMFYQD